MHSPRAVDSRSLALLVLSLLLALTPVVECRSEGFPGALSLQGYTGILNTPNAAVTGEGRLDAFYSNQKDGKFPENISHEDSFMFSLGLLPNLELGARFTEAPANPGTRGGVRDLSGNLKLKLPFLPEAEYLPRVALGIQDVGGKGHRLRTAYLVASEELGRLRLSAGYGTGPDRMKGAFGGAELKAFDWLYLLADYDARDTNLGVRLVAPELFGVPVRLQAIVKGSPGGDGGHVEFGVGLQMPLGAEYLNRKPQGQPEPSAPASPPGTGPGAEIPAPPTELASLTALRDLLTDEGFQNLSLGAGAGGVLVVEYENARYNHNELDGLGVVAGIVCQQEWTGFQTLRLVVRKKGIRMLQLSAPLTLLRSFLRDANSLEELRDALSVTDEISDEEGVRFLGGDSNPSWFRPSLLLYPELRTFLGTEYAPFDYLLSLKPDLFLPVWKGAVLEARWDIPVSWSRGFDDDGPFRDSRKDSRLDRLMLFQAAKLAPSLMVNLGAGMIQYKVKGTTDELLWSPADSRHRVGLRFGYGEGSQTGERYRSYLASYRYLYSPMSLYLEGTGGRFWGGDTGFMVDLKRFFGDTSFSCYYKRVDGEDRKLVQVVGVQFTLPLTPRRDMNPSIVQLKGSDAWSYTQETKLVQVGQNLVGQSVAVIPEPYFNLTNVFYNRDRLSEAYVRDHLLRLRDAYLTYVRHE